MKDALQELFKQSPVFVIIAGAILLIIGASESLALGNFSLQISSAIWKTTIGIIGLVFLGFGIYFVWKESGQSKSPKVVATSSLLESFPPSAQSDFEEAEEVWMVGVSLVRTVRPNYHVIMEKLKKGHTVRVLVVHPTDTLIEPAVQRSFKPTNIERKRSEIIDTLQVLCELQQQTSDKLQIRTIQYPLGYGAHVINPGKTSGVLYIKLYTYRLPDWKPKFVLHADERGWYDYYLKEIRTLWDNGTEWNCEQDT